MSSSQSPSGIRREKKINWLMVLFSVGVVTHAITRNVDLMAYLDRKV